MQNQSAAADFFTLPDAFIIHEHIGSEDRSTEFKKGPGFIDHDFRKNVAKYVSAFINSQQNGKLLIGVDDDGSVVGYGINQGQEDRLKQQIDDAIKDIRPAVHPNDYRVAFIPVVDNSGWFIDNKFGRKTVICIVVQGLHINQDGKLYQTNQGTYLRRDGGVQELGAHEIYQFIERKFQVENARLKNDFTNLHQQGNAKERQLEQKLEEKDKLNRSLESKNRQLEEELNRLKLQREHQNDINGTAETALKTMEEVQKLRVMMEAQNKRSKVCAIS